MSPRLAIVPVCLLTSALSAAPVLPPHFSAVQVAPAKTSIYIGSVTMTMPTFLRHGGEYDAPYKAKVFPFFFCNESGILRVDVSDVQLRQLAAGKSIGLTGSAVRTDGVVRRVTGSATPLGPDLGRLTVKVHVSRHIDLTFHTTYRLVGTPDGTANRPQR